MTTEPPPTLGELVRAGRISIDRMHAAAEAFLRDPSIGIYRFGDGPYAMDLTQAVQRHKGAMIVLGDPKASDGFRRTMILTALVMGPVERR